MKLAVHQASCEQQPQLLGRAQTAQVPEMKMKATEKGGPSALVVLDVTQSRESPLNTKQGLCCVCVCAYVYVSESTKYTHFQSYM